MPHSSAPSLKARNSRIVVVSETKVATDGVGEVPVGTAGAQTHGVLTFLGAGPVRRRGGRYVMH